MHSAGLKLDKGTYELTLLKGDTFHYCQEDAKQVTASLHNELLGDKSLEDHGLHLGILLLERTPNQRHSPALSEGDLSGT